MVFALSSGVETVLIYTAAAVLGALVLGIGRAVMGMVRTRQTKSRQEDFDQRTLSEFFFDTDRDPRTGTPAKIGWTTKVDKTLETLTKGQAEMHRQIAEILYEVKPNGGGNLRGAVERNAADARSEVKEQVTERTRVQKRDHDWDANQ